MSLFAKCRRCDSHGHDGPCLMENPDKAKVHDELLASHAQNSTLRAEIERLRAALEYYAGKNDSRIARTALEDTK